MDWINRLKDILGNIVSWLIKAGELVVLAYKRIWGFLQLKIPAARALVARHVKNPATVFVDTALFVLTIYLAFGITGYVLIYPQKSESRYAEVLSQLYPYPAGRVNNSFFWSHRFLTRLRYLNTFNTQAPSDTTSRPPSDDELRARVMEGLVEDSIMIAEAKKRGIKVTNEELDVAQEKQGKIEDIAAKIRQLYGMSLAEFRQIIAEQVLKEKVKDVVLGKTRVSHILTLDIPSAQEAKRQLAAGKSFADVAKEFSQDAKTRDSGGDLGYWRKGDLTKQLGGSFEEAVIKLDINGISDVVQTQYGFHIINVTDRQGENQQTYEEWYTATIKNYKVKKYLKI